MEPYCKYKGADWIQSAHLGREMTQFERLVADIAGQVERGIYHLPHKSLGLSRWQGDRVSLVYTSGSLATYDGLKLTDYVGLCHLFAVRLEITPMIAIAEFDAEDFESWDYQGELVSHVCEPGSDDGAQLARFERRVTNEDFNPDEPEDKRANPRTLIREYTRSATACLELSFSPRRHDGKCFSDRHLTLESMGDHIRRLGHCLMADHVADRPKAA